MNLSYNETVLKLIYYLADDELFVNSSSSARFYVINKAINHYGGFSGNAVVLNVITKL